MSYGNEKIEIFFFGNNTKKSQPSIYDITQWNQITRIANNLIHFNGFLRKKPEKTQNLFLKLRSAFNIARRWKIPSQFSMFPTEKNQTLHFVYYLVRGKKTGFPTHLITPYNR